MQTYVTKSRTIDRDSIKYFMKIIVIPKNISKRNEDAATGFISSVKQKIFSSDPCVIIDVLLDFMERSVVKYF